MRAERLFIMGEFGTDHSKPDAYDLLTLNLYVQLDAMNRDNAALRARIVARWERFQFIQACFFQGETDQGAL